MTENSDIAVRLPDFLVIGVPRASTTWLYEAMCRHPEIGMPAGRKEIHYFDRNFEKGIEWYRSYFRRIGQCHRIGEVTPHYLYQPDLLDRLKSVPSVCQLVVVLRDPIDRLVSHYRWRMRQDAFQGTLREFVDAYPEAVEWGDYVRHLERLQPWLDNGRLLILSHEFLHADSLNEVARLAEFLGVEVSPFAAWQSSGRINQSHMPRWPGVWKSATRMARRLRDARLDSLVNLARKSGLKSMMESNQAGGGQIDTMLIDDLQAHYRARLDTLDAVCGRDMTSGWSWMQGERAPHA